MRKLFLSFVIFFSSCDQEKNINNDKLPNDVLWVTQSLEYKSICQQVYQYAYENLESTLDKIDSPFIVMDLDETVLDNSSYQIDLFNNKETFNENSWNNWVNLELSKLVPGAKKFIYRYKNNFKNARIIFLSNRSQVTLEATINNMKKLGVLFENDIFLLRENKSDAKIVRRNEINTGLNRMLKYGPQNVVAYFGDAIGDFPNINETDFPSKNFVFPNPMYGKWQR